MKVLIAAAVFIFGVSPRGVGAQGPDVQTLALPSPWHPQPDNSNETIRHRTAVNFIHEKLESFRQQDSSFAIPPTTAELGLIDDIFRERLDRAYAFAVEAHGQQKPLQDRFNTPYLVHILSTAWILVDEMKITKGDAVIEMLLHDYLEDHPDILNLRLKINSLFSHDESEPFSTELKDRYSHLRAELVVQLKTLVNKIRTSFGDNVAEHVIGLTIVNPMISDVNKAQELHVKKMDLHYKALLRLPLHVQLEKISDRLDHLRRLVNTEDPAHRIFYLFSKQFYFLPQFILLTSPDTLNGRPLKPYWYLLQKMRNTVFGKNPGIFGDRRNAIVKASRYILRTLNQLEDLLDEAIQFGAHPELERLIKEHHNQIRLLLTSL